MLIFSLAILIALAGCKKDVSKDLSITTAAGPQQNKQPNLPPSTGDNAQSKLPNQVTPLLADPYSRVTIIFTTATLNSFFLILFTRLVH